MLMQTIKGFAVFVGNGVEFSWKREKFIEMDPLISDPFVVFQRALPLKISTRFLSLKQRLNIEDSSRYYFLVYF
jgi:hypothetical protein